MTTYMLTHWVRDRTRGWRLGLEHAVRRLTSDPAQLYGLPGGAGRLVQRSKGYVATFVSGVQTVDDSERTDERPGRLVRGAR